MPRTGGLRSTRDRSKRLRPERREVDLPGCRAFAVCNLNRVTIDAAEVLEVYLKFGRRALYDAEVYGLTAPSRDNTGTARAKRKDSFTLLPRSR